jgi:hypothetical protein
MQYRHLVLELEKYSQIVVAAHAPRQLKHGSKWIKKWRFEIGGNSLS